MIDYMGLARDLIVNMNGWFAVCIVAFFGVFVIWIIIGSINKERRFDREYKAKKLEYDHEIDKLEQQRKLIDTRVVEGSARRVGYDERDRAERERNNG